MNLTATRRDLLSWFVIGLTLRSVLAWPQRQPGYMDAAYYYDVAKMLATGQGLIENFAWNYLTHPQSLPQPSNAYWMPLTSVVVAPFLWLFGDDFRAAQVPMLLLAAALPPLTYALSLHLFSRRSWAWHSAALMLLSSFYAPFWGVTDSFALYAVISTSLLWLLSILTGTAIRRGVAAAFCAGVVVGLAHLTRADGLLWLAPALLACLYAPDASRKLLAVLVGYGGLMLPWFARNLAVFGTPLNGGALFARAYDDLFVYERPLTFEYWAGSGIQTILESIGRAWLLNFATVAVALCIVYLPFALLAAWRARETPIVALGLAYLGIMYAVLSTVFAAVSWRGTMLHSLSGVLPLLYALAPAGLWHTVVWVSARRRTWNAAAAERLFVPAFVVLAVAVSVWFYVSQIAGTDAEPAWNDRHTEYSEVAAYAAGSGGTHAPVMCVNPPMFNYLTGSASVAIPSDSLESVIAAARQFRVRYLVLEPDHPGILREVYASPESNPHFVLRTEFRKGPGGAVRLFEIR